MTFLQLLMVPLVCDCFVHVKIFNINKLRISKISCTGGSEETKIEGLSELQRLPSTPEGETRVDFNSISPEISASRKNKAVAIISTFIGASAFLFQHTQPASSVAILNAIAKDSPSIQVDVFSQSLFNRNPIVTECSLQWATDNN